MMRRTGLAFLKHDASTLVNYEDHGEGPAIHYLDRETGLSVFLLFKCLSFECVTFIGDKSVELGQPSLAGQTIFQTFSFSLDIENGNIICCTIK